MNGVIKMSVVTQLALAASGVLWAVSAGPALAANDPGITDKNILICAYQPETGTESSYFRMGKGADAWFKYVNDHGGIDGYHVDYKMVDDSYQPARTVAIVKRFIEQDKCFALVAPLGSAPTAAVIDYVVSEKVPIIGAGTGAEKNVTIQSPYVFPLYPSYFLEGQQQARFAKEVFHAKTIALLYQNDPSGQSHLKGIQSVLDKYGLKLVATEGYDPKDIDVSSQAIAMQKANPDAVICSCAPEPLAKFLTQRKELGWNVPVSVVFFGNSPKVPELAGKDAVEGVYFAAIFRNFDSSAPQIQEAKKILLQYYPQEDPDPIHLWGFAGAQVFTEAMSRLLKEGGDITRDRLVASLETIKNWNGSVVPDVTIDHGNAPEHFIVRDMSWMVYHDGKFQEFTPPWIEKTMEK